MTVYKRERLKNINDEYIVTPSMADMVYYPDGQTVEQKINNLSHDFENKLEKEFSIINDKKIYIDSFPRLSGESDDTGRIRRVFSYVEQNGIKELIFSSGEYMITPTTDGSEVGIVIPNDLVMRGEGEVILKTKMSVPYYGMFALNQGDGAKNVTIKNIKFTNLEDTHKVGFVNNDKGCMLLRIGDILGDILIEDCEFHSYAQNPVISYPFNKSEGKVIVRRNKFFFSRHIDDWYDATMLAICHHNVEYYENQFKSINNGTRSWICNTAFEIHSYQCRAYNNDCEYVDGGCLVLSTPPYLPHNSEIIRDIKVYNNRFFHVRTGVQVWGEVVEGVKMAKMENIEVFNNEILLEHNSSYKPVSEHNQLSGYGLSLKVVGNCSGYENIRFHHNNLEFNLVGSHEFKDTDIFQVQRGALSCQVNIPTKEISFTDNYVKNYPYESIIVGSDSTIPYNITFERNTFVDCSYGKDIPLIAFNGCDDVSVKNNKIICENKNYYNFIRFYNRINKNITVLNNDISDVTKQGYNLNIRYDDFYQMVETIKTLNHDIRTIDFISKPNKPRVLFKETHQDLSLVNGDIIFLTSGNIRAKKVNTQFINTKTYSDITCTKENGSQWLKVNNLSNLEVGDIIQVNSNHSVISCIDRNNNRVLCMFTINDFSGSLPIYPIYGTFEDLL